MNIKKVKSSNHEIYYLCKSYRDNKTNKSTSKVIEKLGTKNDIQERIGKGKNVDKWLKDYAKKRTQEEKQQNKSITINFTPNKKTEKNVRRLYNVGYYAIRNMCYEIGLDSILKEVCVQSKFKGDLFQIVTCMIYNRIINAFEEINTYDYSRTFMYPPKFTKYQLYRAIDVLSKYSIYIQSSLYKKLKPISKKSDTLYFDKQSHIFDLEQFTSNDKWYRKNNLLVDYQITMNSNGIPLAFNLPNKYLNANSPDYINFQKTINKEWAKSQLIIFNYSPDEEISQKLNKKFKKTIYVEDQQISHLPNNIKSWIIDDENWNMVDNKSKYNLNDVKEKLTNTKTSFSMYRKLYNASFYKSKTIKIKNKKTNQEEEKTLIVFFNYELQKINAQERLNKILHIKHNIDKAISKNLGDIDSTLDSLLNKYSKLLSLEKDSKDEIKNKYKFKDDVFEYGKEFDGFYVLIADKGDYDIENVIKIHSSRWQIHEPFENLNSEFKYIPNYINHESSVGAHYLICTLMIAVWRMYISKFKSKSYSWEIASKLFIMDYIEIPGIGWLPAFTHDSITELINKISNFDFNYEFITSEQMKTLLKYHDR